MANHPSDKQRTIEMLNYNYAGNTDKIIWLLNQVE